MISVFHARQTNLLFANKFDKILICRLYFHTGFLGCNSSSLRFKLRDMDIGHQGQTSPEFKVVVNFRPEKDVKSMPLKCQNADLSLLFGTKDELVNNREMMGSAVINNAADSAEKDRDSPLFVALSDQPPPPTDNQQPKAPPRSKSKSPPHKASLILEDIGRSDSKVSDDVLISPVTNVKPSVPQPGSPENVLLDFGNLAQPITVSQPNPTSNPNPAFPPDLKEDLFSGFATPKAPPTITSKNVTSSSNTIDCLLDISGNGRNSDLLGNQAPPMMKTSSSAENFKPTTAAAPSFDPFGDLMGLKPTPILSSNKLAAASTPDTIKPATTADDLLSKMLNDLDMNPKSKTAGINNGNGKQPIGVGASSKPNYNVSFNNRRPTGNGSTNQGSASNTTTNSGPSKKVSSNTFDDLLGGFTVNNGNGNNSNVGKSIGEMKNVEVMKTMTPEEAQVFAWKDGKTRNLRALLCSLHTVIWVNSRWSQCGMHQLVNENGVKKMYQKACLAVHPDKQMGTTNEELSKLIFIELNDAWAEFKKDS